MSSSIRRRNQPHHALPTLSTWEEQEPSEEEEEEEEQSSLLSRTATMLFSPISSRSSSSSSSTTKNRDKKRFFIKDELPFSPLSTCTTSSSSSPFPPSAVPIQGNHHHHHHFGGHEDDDEEEESPLSVVGSPSFFVAHSMDEEDAQTSNKVTAGEESGAGLINKLVGSPFSPDKNHHHKVTFASSTTSTAQVVAQSWNDAIQKSHRWILLVTFLFLWPAGWYSLRALTKAAAGEFSTNSSSSSSLSSLISQPVPTDSPSAVALGAFSRNFFNSNNTSVAEHDDDDGWRHDPSRPPLYVVLKAAPTTTTTITTDTTSSEHSFASLTRPDTEPYQHARDFLQSLNRTIHDHCFVDDKSEEKKKCLDPRTWLRLTSFYSMRERDEQLSWLARTTLASPGGKHVMMKIEYRYQNPHKLMELVEDFVQEHAQQQQQLAADDSTTEATQHFTAYATGMPFLQRDLALQSAVSLMAPMNSWTALPLSMFLLCFVLVALPTYRQRASSGAPSKDKQLAISMLTSMVIPLVTLWTTVSVWSVMMHHFFVDSSSSSNPWTLPVVSSLLMGLSLTYSMILLDRYFQEQEQQEAVVDMNINTNSYDSHQSLGATIKAIDCMLESSGPGIIVSSAAMAVVLASLLCMPLPLLQSVGIGACVGMVATVVVQLTLLPALLYARSSLLIFIDMEGHATMSCLSASLLVAPHSTSQNTGGSIESATAATYRQHQAYDDQTMPSSPLQIPLRQTDDNTKDIFRKRTQQDAVSHMFANDTKLATSSDKRNASICYQFVARHLLHPYRGMIVLAVSLLLLLPAAWHARDLMSSWSLSLDLLLPMNSPSYEALQDLAQQFHTVDTTTSGGKDDSFVASAAGSPFMNPYQILFDGRASGRKMTSPAGYDIMHRVVDELMAIDRHPEDEDESEEGAHDEEAQTTHIGMPLEEANHLFHEVTVEMERVEREEEWLRCADDRRLSTPSSDHPITIYNGIAVIHNTRIPYVMYSGAQLCMQMKRCPTKLMHVVDELDHRMTTTDEFGTIITATLGVDPFSKQGMEWLREARSTIERLQEGGALEGVEVYIQGTAATTHDTAEAVRRAFPSMIGFMAIAVALLLGLCFQSAFLSLQSLVTATLTTSFSFGFTALAGPQGESGNTISWPVPAMALCVMVGISVAQDVVFSSRMLEYRLQGHEHKSSIVAALDAVGGVMMAGRLIMALAVRSIAMSGSASTNPVLLQQWSYVVTTALLLDALVIRPLIIPTLMNLTGSRYCWWPRQHVTRPTCTMSCFSNHQQPLLYPATPV